MTHRFPRVRTVSLALAATLLCLGALPEDAAARESASNKRHPAKAQRASVAKAPVEDQQSGSVTPRPEKPMGVWASGEQDRACFRTRRKLWQAGEGWVVKRVSVCP